MKKMLSIFGMVFVLASVAPSALAAIKTTLPVTCPNPLHGMVIVGSISEIGGCDWRVQLQLRGYERHKFDLNKADKVTFDGIGYSPEYSSAVCFYQFFDGGKGKNVGKGYLVPYCGMHCKAVPGSHNKLLCER